MFGRRKREEAAAAEAAREASRVALFAQLAQRPENICPFLGLAGERSGYVDGISDEHRCFAFGDPAPLSAEQQTRVCQERGYGNCPRYLRGVLVIPTEELEALRRPRSAVAPPPPPPAAERRRRGFPLVALLAVLLLLVAGGVGAFFLLGDGIGTAFDPSPSVSLTPEPTVATSASQGISPSPSPSSSPATSPSGPESPTPEPTPEADDTFALYEVSVAPGRYTVYAIGDDGSVGTEREVPFDGFSFAPVEPVEANDGRIYWVTQDGALTGFGYRYPDSGDFRIRAVFLTDGGERRSEFLDEDDLDQLPEGTPAP